MVYEVCLSHSWFFCGSIPMVVDSGGPRNFCLGIQNVEACRFFNKYLAYITLHSSNCTIYSKYITTFGYKIKLGNNKLDQVTIN
jgi:hypothetical protein